MAAKQLQGGGHGCLVLTGQLMCLGRCRGGRVCLKCESQGNHIHAAGLRVVLGEPARGQAERIIDGVGCNEHFGLQESYADFTAN